VNAREQIDATSSAPRGVDDHLPLPQEFRDMIAAMEAELAAHMKILSSHVTSAGVAHRDTLRRLDSLLASWGQRLQSEYEDARRRVDGVHKQYESTLLQFEAFAARYDSVQQQLKDVERQYDGVRQEQEALARQMQGLQQQFEATLAQCRELIGYEQQFKGYAETIAAFDQHLAANTAEFAKLSAAVTVSRRWEWLAMAAAILALAIAGYVGLGKPG
jgi:chromosome segregation ATPase